MLDRIKTQIARLHQCKQGIASVEFALILPIMLALFMGSIEVSQLVVIDRKVSNIAGTMGDLVAQSEDAISTATINDYFNASDHIIAPYATSKLQQIITCVRLDSAGDATVVWSRAHNGATAYTTNASFTIPDSISAVATDTYLIVAESTYAYSPIFGYMITENIDLGEKYVFYPRFGAVIALS